MSRIDNVIADIKDVDRNGHAWIFDADGNIRDDVICGDVIPFFLFSHRNTPLQKGGE